jgi:uncharacterized protein
MRPLRAAAVAAGLLGTYSFIEPYLYRLTTRDVPIANDCAPLSILHLSDTHMLARRHRLAAFLRRLPAIMPVKPDLVLATGDLIEDDDGIVPLVEALAPIEARLGRYYVLGSHDYYRPAYKPLTKYLETPPRPVRAPQADTARLESGLADTGWTSLINKSAVVQSDGAIIRLAGVDDPYLKRHRTDHLRREKDDTLAIGLVHSPDVVSEWFLAGFDLVLAGHTHAGQIRVPGFGALVTNCSLPRALAGGLHRIGGGWMHVSPGLGTGKYSPIRFACRPEATLLRLGPG